MTFGGTPDQLLEANRSILDKRAPQIYRFANSVIIPPVFIGECAVIENAIIGPYASIGSGTQIVNAIIHPNADIQDILIRRSLIGPDTQVRGGFHQFNVGGSAQIDLSHGID